MSRPFTYISSQMYYDLEIYFFRLAMFTDSDEYAALPHNKRNKIDEEIIWMNSMLYLMQMFRIRPEREKPIMAWIKNRKGTEPLRVFRFSSNITAAKCLDVPASKVSAVARNERPSANGYVFQYETQYNEEADRLAETVGQNRKMNSRLFSKLFTELNHK